MAHRFRSIDKNTPAAKQRAADYASPTHRATVTRYRHLIDSGHGQCAETTCLYPTRYIPPGSPFHAAHTPDRTAYLGPAHPRCNLRAAAKAGNAKQQARRQPVKRAQSRAW
jgi:hypothetical protein